MTPLVVAAVQLQPGIVILDAAVLIGAERGTFDMPGYLAALGDAPVAIAAAIASELLHGVERARGAASRQRRSEFVEGVLANVPVIPCGLVEARPHARIGAELAAAQPPTLPGSGVLVSAIDAMRAFTHVPLMPATDDDREI